MITYNHEKYIREAIDGVLMQKTNFEFELIIGEDFSDDNTRQICEEYAKAHPGKIDLLESKMNYGIIPNFIRTLKSCRGKYIALCEGDDYWTDPYKLQKQVDFLDSNKDCTLCFTNGLIIDEDNNIIRQDRVPPDKRMKLTQRDVLAGYVPPANTIMFHRSAIRNFPDEFYQIVNGDFLVTALVLEEGNAGYIDDHTAVYRMHSGGVWSQKPKIYQAEQNLKTRLALLKIFGEKHGDILKPAVEAFRKEYDQLKRTETLKNNKIKNIVISGTNFWNPGDDFVRDGVIKILHYLFPNETLNFLFYNFNQDFLPTSKFSGIHNMMSKGDLEQFRDHVDAVVIAGLSAGEEIKELYNWVIENGLEDRVYLIGAGYENDYVAQYILQEPEKTIFMNAKIITGRTKKVPSLIHELKLPYHHINCPALLSVESVKNIQPDKKIEKIGFSIQIPHEIGIVNQATGKSMYTLAVELLDELSSEYEVTVIAHHKSEYFHFLALTEEKSISANVYFSSFYQDLHSVYPQFDLLVTTRLHSGLFANGFGIPAIIINETDRHTHCLEGFPHAVWINSREKFLEAFSAVKEKSLADISSEMRVFKQKLIGKYLEVLFKPFGVNVNRGTEKIAESIKKEASSVEVKKRVLEVFEKLEADYWLRNNITNYKKAIDAKNDGEFDTVSFLNWFADKYKPKTYLEIGVRRGRSMAQVLSRSKDTRAVGIDLWIENYSSIPEENIVTTNPGPDFVVSELKKFGVSNLPQLIKGDSQKVLPEYFKNEKHIRYFDLILVDGDHSYKGARYDLEMCIPHLNEGGILIFDDINHISHPELKDLWNELKAEYPEHLFLQDESGTGTGIMSKPPFKTVPKDQMIGTKNSEADLPIHFFTIVLNGKPFIDYHINVMKKLPFKWHWHIVEGVADLKHDTSWSLENGGKIDDSIHNKGLSKDGTAEYLNELSKLYPDNVTVYRKENNSFWEGKIEMVSRPLENIKEECLLWQVDVDELWTAKQMIEARNMFLKEPSRTAAYFYCFYFVGEKRIIVTENTYGNHTDYEWLRLWKYQPGDKWLSHEPPQLSRMVAEDIWIDLGKVNVFTHADTKSRNLVFQHYAYVTEEQLKFKEIYYGYKDPVAKWKELNSVSSLPAALNKYFEWVTDGATVENIGSLNINPLAHKNGGDWRFADNVEVNCSKQKIFYSADDYSLQAEDEIRKENLNRARHLLLAALNLDGNNIDAMNNFAVVEIMEGEFTEADSLLNKILSLDPGNDVANDNRQILNDILNQNISATVGEDEAGISSKNTQLQNIEYLKFQLNFDLNDGCNLNCVMCGNVPNKTYKYQNVMSWDIFQKNLAPAFKHATVFQFGCFFEPLMVPYFEKAILAIKDNLPEGIKGTIITNGMLLNDSKITAMVDSGIFSKIRFSIDSISEELFEKIRVGAKLKILLKNIEKLVQYINQKKSKTLVEVNFTIMPENILELPKLVLLAKEIGVNSITTHKLTPQDVSFVDEEYFKILTENISMAEEMARKNKILFSGQVYRMQNDYEDTINKIIMKDCGYDKKNYLLLTIDSHGNVNHPCKIVEGAIGNLTQNSFEEIIGMEKFGSLYDAIKNPDSRLCTECGMFI